MGESSDDFRLRYAAMEDAELLHLARAYDSLVAPAQEALRLEFAKRNIEPPIIEDDGPKPALRDLVTLTRYRDLFEAIVARCMLESAGVPAWLRDENLGRLGAWVLPWAVMSSCNDIISADRNRMFSTLDDSRGMAIAPKMH